MASFRPWPLLLLGLLIFTGTARADDTPPPPSGEKKGGWRLATQKSDYLREHASNPVEWYPWGDEAFAKAKELDRMVFLSIGYSSCHWCHVMRRESFSSEKIAAVMNKYFICVKVDREELPHVDSVYMDAVQRMTGRGGWPLSVWLTPEGVPLVGGTYFPPEDSSRGPGFLTIINRLHEVWTNERPRLEEQGTKILKLLRESQQLSGDAVDPDLFVAKGVEIQAGRYDPRYGGFGEAPKFPSPRAVQFLATVGLLEDRPQLREMAVNTLRQWAAGGICDQIGGGFHRYSTDAQWAVPHFEKMLYNQGLNAEAYLEVARMTGEDDLEDIARRTLDALLRDFRLDHGAFAASWDADSEEKEGTFYVWTPEEVEAVVGAADSPLVCAYYGITSAGNFEGGPHSVPSRRRETVALAQEHSMAHEQAARKIETATALLLAARAKRVPPHQDKKVILGWNALAISALARGSVLLGDNRYLEAALAAQAFCFKHLVTDAAFFRRYADGEAHHPATLRDVAYLLKASLDLYEATFDTEHVARARRLADRIIENFGPGEKGGGFFDAQAGDEILIERSKRFWDGAIPSGNGTLARSFVRLHALTGDGRYRTLAEGIVVEASKAIGRAPSGSPELLLATLAMSAPFAEVAVVGDLRSPITRALLDPARRGPVPFAVVTHRPLGQAGEAAAKVIPLLEGRTTIANRPAAYLCVNFVCQQPETNPSAFGAALEALWKPKAPKMEPPGPETRPK